MLCPRQLTIHPPVNPMIKSRNTTVNDHSSLTPSKAGGRPQLVIDLEDTIVSQKRETVAELNRRYGTKIALEEVKSFFVQDAFQARHGIEIGRPEIIEIHRGLWTKGPELLDPNTGAIFKKLETSYELSIVTASVADGAVISSFLEEKGIVHQDLLIVNSSGDKIKERPNSFACIDDHSKVVMDFAINGKIGMVLHWPWNEEANHQNVLRVRNWQEVEEVLLDDLTKRAIRV